MIGGVKRICRSVKMEPADITEQLQVTSVDDVMGAASALPLADGRHALDITRTEASQPGTPQSPPGQLQAQAKAAARLNAGDCPRRRYRWIWQFGLGHTL